MNRSRFGEHVARGEHAVDGPHKIHGRRTRVPHAQRGSLKRLVVGQRIAQQRDAVGAEDADAGRAAHGERFYRGFDFIDRRRAPHEFFVRQAALIDVFTQSPSQRIASNGSFMSRAPFGRGGCAVP